MIKPRATVLFVNDDDEVLLIHRNKFGDEYFQLPGGGIEVGETPIEAAMREGIEETSLYINDLREVCSLWGEKRFEHFFLSRDFSGIPQLGDCSERRKQSPSNRYDFEWLPVEALATINLKPKGGAEKVVAMYKRGWK